MPLTKKPPAAKAKAKTPASQPKSNKVKPLNGRVRLLIEPDDGVAPVVKGLDAAKKTIDILIFRFDHRQVEEALLRAASRGVRVRALIAYTNRGGEKSLRALEMRLLAAGITVARTADDLVRYHGKMIVVDESRVFILGFNFTYLDIDHSRSFGVVIEDDRLVGESMNLFDSDILRRPYTAGHPALVVSPGNARAELGAFIRGAKKELLIYDPNVSDGEMLKILEERAAAGVEIRILGRAARLPACKLAQIRLHARVMIRDRAELSIGSQSLRTLELDGRREVGVVLRNPDSARRVAAIFDEDWKLASDSMSSDKADSAGNQVKKIAKTVAKAMTQELPPVAELLDLAVKEVGGDSAEVQVDTDQLQDSIEEAVKRVVKETVRDAVGESKDAT